jgi:hypothetical protein
MSADYSGLWSLDMCLNVAFSSQRVERPELINGSGLLSTAILLFKAAFSIEPNQVDRDKSNRNRSHDGVLPAEFDWWFAPIDFQFSNPCKSMAFCLGPGPAGSTEMVCRVPA